MGKGRRTKNFIPYGSAAPAPTQATSYVKQRGLAKSHLGGVIFGCTNSTIKECFSKQLFGLPAAHYSYVKNIHAGLPLFLFNYNDRQLHGIFVAASSGQMNINPYAWVMDGEEGTPYSAQVQIHVQLQCHPLSEEQFKPAMTQNYYNQRQFFFELDRAQTTELISLLSSHPIAPSTFFPEDTTRRALLQTVPSNDRRKETEDEPVMKKEETLISMKQKDSFDYTSVITQLIQGLEALKEFNEEQNDKLSCLAHHLEAKVTVLKAQIEKLQQERDEFQRMVIGNQQVQTEQIHQMKEKEKEYVKLQERLNQVLMEKKEESRLGMEMMNLLQKEGWQHERWNGKEADNDFYKKIVDAYEAKNQELVAENADLRALLRSMQVDMRDLLNAVSCLAKQSLLKTGC